MKVKISETVEVSDAQRLQMADVLDGKQSRRQATRDEMKEFIWTHGDLWASSLADEHAVLFGPSDEADEDLIGDTDDELSDLL